MQNGRVLNILAKSVNIQALLLSVLTKNNRHHNLEQCEYIVVYEIKSGNKQGNIYSGICRPEDL